MFHLSTLFVATGIIWCLRIPMLFLHLHVPLVYPLRGNRYNLVSLKRAKIPAEMTSYSFSSLPPGDDGAWLLDHSDDTCNNGTAHTVNLSLTTPRPLTWVRLVVSQPGRLDQLHVSYQDSSEDGLTPCHHARGAKVDERTLDILCPTQTAVDSVTVSGAGVQELCSLYISAGRNVALKQATTQSSTFNSWAASNAVDGNQGEPGRNPAKLEKTCSHTNNHNIGWWKVTFSRAVNINSFVIYNRRRDQPDDINVDCCESRLRGFTLRAFQDGVSAAVYTYTDTAASAKPVDEVVPTHTIDGPVRSVNITKRQSSTMLTLCEVLVLGETVCPAGKFGLNCDRQCNCADTQELCFVSTGGCTSGCAPGFTGEDCHTACPGKTYGPDCVGTCSDHCGSSQICSADNGHCVDGCNPGYTPPLCDDECPKTTFGQDCQEKCSSSCVDSDCDHVNGTCKQCPPGYIGDYCNQECPIYTFGDGCSETCSAFCVDRICLHTTGACGNCTEGRQGHFCEIVPQAFLMLLIFSLASELDLF
ncbi:hypothetical protein RRG08_002047 [Elysia crispata]|uniref:Fucolectin-related molecule n=1 Tax=Elysia crispata TaxID=231223 RepID=A0AAE1DIU3_9GAST|nr:hypothetical protein RRG08_002047 [Elysia crispata]